MWVGKVGKDAPGSWGQELVTKSYVMPSLPRLDAERMLSQNRLISSSFARLGSPTANGGALLHRTAEHLYKSPADTHRHSPLPQTPIRPQFSPTAGTNSSTNFFIFAPPSKETPFFKRTHSQKQLPTTSRCSRTPAPIEFFADLLRCQPQPPAQNSLNVASARGILRRPGPRRRVRARCGCASADSAPACYCRPGSCGLSFCAKRRSRGRGENAARALRRKAPRFCRGGRSRAAGRGL